MKKVIFLVGSLLLLAGCNPTVRIEAPKEPIKIEASITIEIRVVVEKEVEQIFEDDEELF
jgi:uncharacterized protein YcfL